MKLLEMRLKRMGRAGSEIPEQAEAGFPDFLKFAVARLKVLWRSAPCWIRGKRKALSVCETAAIGDRRFVSVVQFERQRFLIGSSASSVTLLALLPDEATFDGGDKEKENGGTRASQQMGEIR